MNVFFFQHPLETDDWVRAPGRYPFDVAGPALERDGQTFRRTAWEGRIYADGKGPRTPSTNMDPHVLSDILPAFLSFCRIDKLGRNEKNIVQHVHDCAHGIEPQLLSEVVASGDLVFFGGVPGPRILFVDFVMCVGSVVELPVYAGGLSLEPARPNAGRPDFAQWWRKLQPAHGDLTWTSFLASRTFLLNLADALPPRRASTLTRSPAMGKHHKSERTPRFQIIGRRTVLPNEITATGLHESFTAGSGFNFTPLNGGADPALHSSARWVEQIRRRPGLLVLDSQYASKVVAPVTCLGPDDGLLREILDTATVLVHEPLHPTTDLLMTPPPR